MNPQQKRYGDYTLLDSCAKGGFGEVWRACGFDGITVALKIIGTQYRGSSWESELKGLRAYQQKIRDNPHPNLLQIFYAGEAENCFYYTMELADSLSQDDSRYLADTLAERLKQNGRLNATATLNLIDALLSGVEKLHDLGLIHRDIKPDNILWIKGVPKLADVGLVRDPAHTVSRGGTRGFFPPERHYSNSQADDLYGLSMVAYCALTGYGPEKFPEIPIGLPTAEYVSLRKIFIRGCGSDAKKRFRSAKEFRKELAIPLSSFPKIQRNLSWFYRIFEPLLAALGMKRLLHSKVSSQPQVQQVPLLEPELVTTEPPEIIAFTTHEDIEKLSQIPTKVKKQGGKQGLKVEAIRKQAGNQIQYPQMMRELLRQFFEEEYSIEYEETDSALIIEERSTASILEDDYVYEEADIFRLSFIIHEPDSFELQLNIMTFPVNYTIIDELMEMIKLTNQQISGAEFVENETGIMIVARPDKEPITFSVIEEVISHVTLLAEDFIPSFRDVFGLHISPEIAVGNVLEMWKIRMMKDNNEL